MITYFAFLRGINVGGHMIIKMAELKSLFEKLGYKNVKTYIQSGNVKFDAVKSKPETLAKKIGEYLGKSLGHEVTVIVRSKVQVKGIVAGYPFAKVRGHEKCNIHVAFLSAEPGQNEASELISLNCNAEMFNQTGDNVYVLLRSGVADSLTGKNIIEKKLKVRATLRNWNTVNKMLAL